MSVPTPSGGQDGTRGGEESPTRRVSEGDRLDTARLRGGQREYRYLVSQQVMATDNAVTASPGQVPAPIVSESADKDFNQRMRNISISQDSTPPALSPHHYDYNYSTPQYSPYTPTSSHQAQGPPNGQAWRGPTDQPMYPSYTRYQSQPGYQVRPPYLESAPSDFSIETMHGMPGYPVQPPIARSMQSTSPQYSSQASITPRPYGWGSPPMSPAMSSVPFGSTGQAWLEAGQGRGGYGQDGHGDEYGHLQVYGHGQPPYYDQGPRQGWPPSGPSSPYAYYPPYQHQPPPPRGYQNQHQRPPPRDYHPPRPPLPPQNFSQHRGSWAGPDQRPPPANQNRMSWSGQAGGDSKDRERKAYHPQPPARRSDWVMWVGNV